MAPDGGRIAYTMVNWHRGWEDIAVINLDNSVVTRFSIPGSLELSPDWQPV